MVGGPERRDTEADTRRHHNECGDNEDHDASPHRHAWRVLAQVMADTEIIGKSLIVGENRMLRRPMILALVIVTAQPAAAQTFVDTTATNLPAQDPRKFSMAAA